MWYFLFGLTALVLVLPLVPALFEWRRPTDIAPLHIDAADALDPTWPARSAAERMFAAVADGSARFEGRKIAQVPAGGTWPLDPDERLARASSRTWYAAGDAALPPRMNLVAEVFAIGSLHTGARNLHGALWARRRLRLAEGSTVLRWAHGDLVDVEHDCRLAGPVTADDSIRMATGCRFVLLHAPAIRFAVDEPDADEATARPSARVVGLPDEVNWDDASRRGLCGTTLDLGPDRSWQGDLVCREHLAIGRGCTSSGNVKARGRIVVGPGALIDGALVAEDAIEIGEGSVVLGAVVSEAAVVLHRGCRIGAPGRPATVSAPRIDIAAGVVVHGTLWAGQRGKVLSVGVPWQSQAAPPVIDDATEPLAA